MGNILLGYEILKSICVTISKVSTLPRAYNSVKVIIIKNTDWTSHTVEWLSWVTNIFFIQQFYPQTIELENYFLIFKSNFIEMLQDAVLFILFRNSDLYILWILYLPMAMSRRRIVLNILLKVSLIISLLLNIQSGTITFQIVNQYYAALKGLKIFHEIRFSWFWWRTM